MRGDDSARRFAVIGGAGFLGYHLAHRLASRGIPVTLVDVAPFEVSEYPPGVRCVRADVRDAALAEILRDHAVVIHAAAALPSRRRREIFDVNVRGTRTVLDASLAAGVERVIYLSTAAVYGVPRKAPLHETDPVQAIGAYAASKIAAEHVCAAYRRNGLCVPIVRAGTFLGTGRLGVFQILYDWVLRGKRIPIIGDGTNRYQLLEVSDLVEAIDRLSTAPSEVVNDTFNVGAQEFQTVAEDVGALCAAAGSGARVLPTPAWAVKSALTVFEALGLSPLHQWMYRGADRDYIVSTERLEARLGWHSRVSNAQALIHSYQWYVQHHHELTRGSGVTHRRMWDQGILSIFKRWL